MQIFDFEDDGVILDLASKISQTNGNKAPMSSAKIQAAKEKGIEEIDKYKAIICKAAQEISELALFDNVNIYLETMFIDQMLELCINPVFKGQRPDFLDQETYINLRKDLFRKLIKKYEL